MSTKNNWISLRVQWNPKTGALRMPTFVELSGGVFTCNPAEEAFREFGLVVVRDASDPGTSVAVYPTAH